MSGKITPATIERMRAAEKAGRLRIVRHVTDGAAKCDLCGKPRAGWAVSICRTREDARADYERVGPVYLNGECYLVGATCLRDLKQALKGGAK